MERKTKKTIYSGKRTIYGDRGTIKDLPKIERPREKLNTNQILKIIIII